MDAKKLLGIEFLFQGIHGLMQQIASPFAVKFHVISGRCDPVDILRANDLNAGANKCRVTYCVAAVFTPELEAYSESLRLISEILPEWRRQHDGKYS
jgi:hypothetical protein